MTDPLNESWEEKAKRLGYTYQQGIENAISIIRNHAMTHNLSRDAVLQYYQIGVFASEQLFDLDPREHGDMAKRRADIPETPLQGPPDPWHTKSPLED